MGEYCELNSHKMSGGRYGAAMPGYARIDHEYGAELATTPPDEDGPVWMINLMRYKDRAEYADGRETALTGREADDEYTPVGPLAAVGAEIVFVADVVDQLLGDAPRWDRVAVVRYPTRRSFVEMQQRPDFQELHEHKDAGMAQTIVMGTQPMPGPRIDMDDIANVEWSDVPHPPTAEDGEVMVIHVLRFHDEVGAASPDDMEAYTRHAAAVAARHGGRVAGWFEVEGTILGDGRRWDQVRFNAFPSRAAFMAVVFDPDRLEAQRGHREPAIADTYTLVTRPVIDRFAASTG
jgi:uncharacterized protein (DUF1330 family)